MPATIENVVVFSLLEAARILQVNVGTVRTYAKRGDLRHTKIGGTILVSARALEEYIKSNGMEVPEGLAELAASADPATV